MDDFNPYSSPTATVPQNLNQPTPADGGVWRKGNRLIVSKQARLPDVCVKTGDPSFQRISRKFYWHHPAVLLTVIIHPLVYVVVALVARKRHDIQIPLSEDACDRRDTGILRSWLFILVGLAGTGGTVLFFANRIYGRSTDESLTWIGLGGLIISVLTLFGAVFVRQRKASILRPKHMTDSVTQFLGAGSGYLDTLPEYPYPN